MTVVGFLTQNTIRELTLNDIQNLARLTQTNIYAEINQELVEPLNTAIIMAQNTFVVEMMDEDTVETESKIASYLSAIQKTTGYESVFLVPHSTLSYYHPGGTDAKVDLESKSSFWYKERVVSEDPYSIVVNTEQLDDNALTLYINANMKDASGQFIGLTGVGKRITQLREILGRYEETFGVRAYLVDDHGLILIHSNESLIKEETVFELEEISTQALTLWSEQALIQDYQIDNKFFIVQGIPMLNWNLVVTKSTSALTRTLNEYSMRIYLSLLVAAVFILIATRFTIDRYKNQIVYLSNIDQLTRIPNRTIFDLSLREAIDSTHETHFCLALYDLDNLKHINDELGHDKGDEALKVTAELAKSLFTSPDMVARVGGDEFAIIMYQQLHEAEKSIDQFHDIVQKNLKLRAIDATVSIGVAESRDDDSARTVYKRADEALYTSKKSGKNTVKSTH